MSKSLVLAATLALLSLPFAATGVFAQSKAPDCGDSTLAASTKIKVAACIDLNDWNASTGTGDQEFVYFSKDGKAALAIVTELPNVPMDAYRDAIIAFATKSSGAAEGSIEPIDPEEQDINGKPFQSMLYDVSVQGNDLEFLNYYYSEAGIGSVQFIFWSIPDDVGPVLTPLADKVMETVSVGE